MISHQKVSFQLLLGKVKKDKQLYRELLNTYYNDNEGTHHIIERITNVGVTRLSVDLLTPGNEDRRYFGL